MREGVWYSIFRGNPYFTQYTKKSRITIDFFVILRVQSAFLCGFCDIIIWIESKKISNLEGNMPRKKTRGRPAKINATLVNAICRAAEDEILPVARICERFAILRQTFEFWMLEGRNQREQPIDDLFSREILCCELAERLDKIYAAHEEQLRVGFAESRICNGCTVGYVPKTRLRFCGSSGTLNSRLDCVFITWKRVNGGEKHKKTPLFGGYR